MLISYLWLSEFLKITLPPRELADRLTAAGLAVEGIHTANDDFILDFDLTSNRPDCLSHLGIAREVAVIEQQELFIRNAPVSLIETLPSLISTEELPITYQFKSMIPSCVPVTPPALYVV